MTSFRRLAGLSLPVSSVWLVNDIAEARGRQDLYTRQAPQLLAALRQTARVQSVESSNRIEGVTVAPDRLIPLVVGDAEPRDRSEEEIRGYRRALDLIHTSAQDLPIEGKHDLLPWLNYFLAIVKRAYRELEERAGEGQQTRGAKTALVEAAISSFAGEFSLADVERASPGVSRDMVRHVLQRLQRAGKVECIGFGPGARWRRKE